MKKMILGLMIAIITGGVSAECSYNLDATQAQITAMENGLLKFPTIMGQKVSFNITPTTTSNNSHEMKLYYTTNAKVLQENRYNILTPPSSGIFAFEYKFKVPLNQMSNGEQILFFPIIAGSRSSNGLTQGNIMGYFNSSDSAANMVLNTFRIGDENSQTLVELPVTNTNDGYQRIGVYINQITKKVGFILNGVNKGYLDSYSLPVQGYYFEHGAGITGFTSTSSNLGKEISIELITDHSKFSQTYPSGTTDICGNTI